MTKKLFPLPSSHFTTPTLSSEDKAYFISLGEQSLRTFIEKALAPIDASWQEQGEVEGVRLFEGIPDRRNKYVVPFQAQTMINGTLHEIAMLHASETRELCLQQTMRYPSMLDMIPLYNFIDRSDHTSHRQVYVKWIASTIGVPFVKDRDFLFLESQDEFTLDDGRNAWAYCQHSIALPISVQKGFSNSLGSTLVRGSLYHTGCIFIESATNPGMLEVRGHIAIDLKGAMPRWVRKLCLQRRAAQQIGLLDQHIHEMRLSSMVPLHSLVETMVLDDIKTCNLCERSFGIAPASNCQRCGHAVCRRCSQQWRHSHAALVRVCTECSKTIRESSEWQIRQSLSGFDHSSPNHPRASRSASVQLQSAPPSYTSCTETLDVRGVVEKESRLREAKKEKARQAMYNQLTPGMDRFLLVDTIRSDQLDSNSTVSRSSKTFDLAYLQSLLADNPNSIELSKEQNSNLLQKANQTNELLQPSTMSSWSSGLVYQLPSYDPSVEKIESLSPILRTCPSRMTLL